MWICKSIFEYICPKMDVSKNSGTPVLDGL